VFGYHVGTRANAQLRESWTTEQRTDVGMFLLWLATRLAGNTESYGEFMDAFRRDILPDAESVAEYAAEGFKAMVLRGEDSYETSHEKIDRASSMLSDAEAALEEACREIDRSWAVTQAKLLMLHERLLDINASILTKWIDVVEPYISSDYLKSKHLEARLASQVESLTLVAMRMQSRVKAEELAEMRRRQPSLPDLTRLDQPSLERILPDILICTAMPRSVILAPVSIPMPTRLSQRERIGMADEFLADVLDFREQVGVAVTEAQRETVKYTAIGRRIEEAHRVFDRLAEHIIRKTDEIKAMVVGCMDRSALEAAIDVSIAFAYLIHNLGCTPILDGGDLSLGAERLISCAESLILEVEP
jgi:hypothetical protein